MTNITADLFIWEDDFPPVYAHTSISFLKRCPGYEKAKRGNMQAALMTVKKCIKPERIAELRRKYPQAVLLPVMTENRLPEALAQTIGLKTNTGVHEEKTQNRKRLSAMERLLDKPSFRGKIKKGESYIIIDDVVTQGGTISELRKHVILCGGSVVAVVALAISAGSHIIALGLQDAFELTNKFSFQSITSVLRKYYIAYELWELTRPQARYLLRFNELDNMVEKIEETYYSQDKTHVLSL